MKSMAKVQLSYNNHYVKQTLKFIASAQYKDNFPNKKTEQF